MLAALVLIAEAPLLIALIYPMFFFYYLFMVCVVVYFLVATLATTILLKNVLIDMLIDARAEKTLLAEEGRVIEKDEDEDEEE